MSKHTPAPWFVDEITRKTNEIKIWAKGTPLIARVFLRDVSINEQYANAELIAAAPDLLEALKLCAAVCAGEALDKSSLINALEASRAAIAKATGGAS